MKTILVSTSFSYLLKMENVGISRIKAYLTQKNKDVDVFYYDDYFNADKLFAKMDLTYDIYGFSVYEDNIEMFIEMAKKIKAVNKNATIVFGSKFASLYYEEILKCCDFDLIISLGDGEYTFIDLIEAKEKNVDSMEFAKNHPNIAIKGFTDDKVPLSIKVGELPWPDRSYIKQTKNIAAYICDCHGCVGRCAFCSQRLYYKHWEGRTAEDIFKEVKSIYDETCARLFIFTGGSFEDPGEKGKDRIREFCNYIIESKIKVSFRCFLRAETFHDNEKDRQLLKLMKKAGFNVAFVGIESGNDNDLKLYQKRATLNDNNLTLSLLKDADIFSGGFGFIMFNPYSTMDNIRQNYEFLAKNNTMDIAKYVSELMIYHNTPIYHKVKNDNLLIPKHKYPWNDIKSYSFINEDVDRLHKFILEHVKPPKLDLIAKNNEFVWTTVEGFYTFFEDGIGIRNQVNEIMNEQAALLRKYFYELYINNNFEYCKENLENFINELSKLDARMSRVSRKLMKNIVKGNFVD